MTYAPPKGYYHICYRPGECWACGDPDGLLGQWGGQVVCHECMSGKKPYRPCVGPFCSGDSDHKVCECNAS